MSSGANSDKFIANAVAAKTAQPSIAYRAAYGTSYQPIIDAINKSSKARLATGWSGDSDKELAKRYEDDWTVTSPYLEQMLNQSIVNSNSRNLIDVAKKQIQRTAMGTDEAMNYRQMGRGNVNLTPSQQLAMASNNSIAAGANNTANMNIARTSQYEANVDALNRLVATTNAMKKGSASTLGGIAQNEANREAQRSAARAADKQARNGLIASGVGLVATIGMAVF